MSESFSRKQLEAMLALITDVEKRHGPDTCRLTYEDGGITIAITVPESSHE